MTVIIFFAAVMIQVHARSTALNSSRKFLCEQKRLRGTLAGRAHSGVSSEDIRTTLMAGNLPVKNDATVRPSKIRHMNVHQNQVWF